MERQKTGGPRSLTGGTMEFGSLEFAMIIVAAVSVLAVAFSLAWMDATPRRSRSSETRD